MPLPFVSLPPPKVGLLAAQYTGLFLASSTLSTDSFACIPSLNTQAYRGWETGVCLTEEQVWCRAHSKMHLNCPTADCRAEEIRLSLFRGSKLSRPSKTPVYTGCTTEQVEALWDHFEAMGGVDKHWVNNGNCAACVPAGDPRSLYLPGCSEEQAFCRGLYFRPAYSNASSWECAQLPRDYSTVRKKKNTYFGCG